jgi:hypothetical protein
MCLILTKIQTEITSRSHFSINFMCNLKNRMPRSQICPHCHFCSWQHKGIYITIFIRYITYLDSRLPFVLLSCNLIINIPNYRYYFLTSITIHYFADGWFKISFSLSNSWKYRSDYLLRQSVNVGKFLWNETK